MSWLSALSSLDLWVPTCTDSLIWVSQTALSFGVSISMASAWGEVQEGFLFLLASVGREGAGGAFLKLETCGEVFKAQTSHLSSQPSQGNALPPHTTISLGLVS